MDYRPQSDLRPRQDDAPRDAFLTEQDLVGPNRIWRDVVRHRRSTWPSCNRRPPPAVAERLRLATGELAVVRRRIRFIDGQPFHTNDSYFSMLVAEGTAVMSPVVIPCGANLEIARHGGDRLARGDRF